MPAIPLPVSAVRALVCVPFLTFLLFAPAVHAEMAATAADGGQLAKRARYDGHVYLLRGFANVFSRGLDDLGRKMRARGIQAQVLNHSRWPEIATIIAADRRKPVVLIGHSLGGNAVVLIAERLKRAGVPVRYLVTFDATSPRPVPSNVGKATNYYYGRGSLGESLRPGPGFRGRLKNIDVSKGAKVSHFNIEKQPSLHRQVIINTLRFVRRRTADTAMTQDAPRG